MPPEDEVAEKDQAGVSRSVLSDILSSGYQASSVGVLVDSKREAQVDEDTL